MRLNERMASIAGRIAAKEENDLGPDPLVMKVVLPEPTPELNPELEPIPEP